MVSARIYWVKKIPIGSLQSRWPRSMHDDRGNSSIETTNIFASPDARRIVQLLQNKGWASVRELQDTLQISTDLLREQLSNLEGLVSRGSGQRYHLTREGEIVASSLKLRNSNRSLTRSRKNDRGLRFLFNQVMFGGSLQQFLNRHATRSLPLGALILAVGGLVSFLTNLEPILLFYISPRPGVGQAWFILLFPIGWLITYATADLLAYVFFHRRGGELELVNGSIVAMLPLLLVPALVYSIQPFSMLIQSATTLTILIQVAIQIWVVCLLSNAISSAKDLPIERTALISLTVMYLNVVAVFVALQAGFF